MDTSELVAVLLIWAAHLSSYACMEEIPHIEYRGQAFFVEHACATPE